MVKKKEQLKPHVVIFVEGINVKFNIYEINVKLMYKLRVINV